MKQTRYRKINRRLNNKGFSLVEVLISIAVLVIIMVPLMSNFIRSMQMNNKARKLQVQSNLASSIMESIKAASSMTEIMNMFKGTYNIDMATGTRNAMRLQKNGVGYTDNYLSDAEEEANYFAIQDINIEGTSYDVFIEMNAGPYRIQFENKDVMNNYKMPNPINLDKTANGLLFSNGTADGKQETGISNIDENALNTFAGQGRNYAQMLLEQSADYQAYLDSHDLWHDQYEQAVDKSTVDPEPPEPTLESYALDHDDLKGFYDTELLKNRICKTMKVSVNGNNLSYQVDYSCTYPSGNLNNEISYPVSNTGYADTVENAYLFYTPSIFQAVHGEADTFTIENKNPVNPVNFYIALQQSLSITKPIKIKRFSENDNISVYTNFEDADPVTLYIGDVVNSSLNTGLVKSSAGDRIYDVTINVCKSDPGSRYSKILYQLRSTKER